MSQSGAILTWFAETHGMFCPAGAEEKFETLRWLLFDNQKFTGSFAAHRILQSMTPEPAHPTVLAYMRSRAEGAFSIVDKHLANRSVMLGDRPTIVEFSWLDTYTIPQRRPASILPRLFPYSTNGASAWRRYQDGSRRMN